MSEYDKTEGWEEEYDRWEALETYAREEFSEEEERALEAYLDELKALIAYNRGY